MSESRHDQRGSLAVEALLVLPVVAVLTVGLLGLLVPVTDALLLDATARSAVRAVSLEGSDAAAGRVVAELSPGAAASVERRAGLVVVTVTRTRTLLGRPSVTTARAVAPLEPGAHG